MANNLVTMPSIGDNPSTWRRDEIETLQRLRDNALERAKHMEEVEKRARAMKDEFLGIADTHATSLARFGVKPA